MNFSHIQLTIISIKLEKLSLPLLYLTLGIIYIWFGGIKFTAGQAEGIYSMISANSLVAWMYTLFSKQGLVYFLGSIEIVIGLLVIGRFINPILSFVGAFLSMILFTITISMMVFLLNVSSNAGFPVLSFVGEFLLKDIGLFAMSLFVASNSLNSITYK